MTPNRPSPVRTRDAPTTTAGDCVQAPARSANATAATTRSPATTCEECKAKKRSGLQTKLQIDAPDDACEQRGRPYRGTGRRQSPVSAVTDVSPRIQRVTGQWSPSPESAPPSVERTLAATGQPLEPALRNDMEQRFGHDFSGVRVHSGALAEQSARDVQAHAYTAGTSVVFGAGRYSPDTHAGRRLLAHELTHVVQQGGSTSRVSRSGRYLQRDKAPQPAPPGGTCQSATLADQFKPTNTWGGKPWDPTLGRKEFGTTSKLAANFGFGACKEGGFWKFHLNKLEVMVASKVQPKDFRINIDSANGAEVTKEKTPTILADLRPDSTVTFRPGCGTRQVRRQGDHLLGAVDVLELQVRGGVTRSSIARTGKRCIGPSSSRPRARSAVTRSRWPMPPTHRPPSPRHGRPSTRF